MRYQGEEWSPKHQWQGQIYSSKYLTFISKGCFWGPWLAEGLLNANPRRLT
jgi:hypothetical protein